MFETTAGDQQPDVAATRISVSVREACRLIGLGNTTLWGLIKDGRIQTVKVGRRRLVVYASLEELIKPLSGNR